MEKSKPQEGTLKSYTIGFILSIILTLIPYFLVTNHLSTGWIFVGIILLFAMIQLIVQMLFFLHMGKEARPRWKGFVFVTFVGTILIVVIASIWIMQHLNYNMNLLQLNNVMQYGEGF